ncbi:ficolin-2-like [Drosophila novamexicana]|uniref:ficolin-2-like n=1 Tax=Drosophila novamexicana TaxID=47314 RepID=UPI0011E5BD10|nr:ficolin-2-like [Drosophila novamexicana]
MSSELQIILIACVVIWILKSENHQKKQEEPVSEVPNMPKVKSREDFIKEMEESWSAYFVYKIKPTLEQTMNIQGLHQQIMEQEEMIIAHQKLLGAMQTNLSVCEINNKAKEMIIDQLLSRVLLSDANKLVKSFKSNCIGKLTEIYEIEVPGIDPFLVPCDSTLAGSGWTVIQRRQDGSVNFNRNWAEYRQGFGSLDGEFFIGLEKLHLMTKSQKHELYIHLEDFENQHRYARYSELLIADEAASYMLRILGEYSGNAGDWLTKHNNTMFSTADMDNECAMRYESGWWYHNCSHCNLNGLYTTNEDQPGIKWNSISVKFVQMMIRPIEN